MQEVIALARQYTVEAINTLAAIMQDPKAPYAARNAAAATLLDRAWGKPTQPLAGDGGGMHAVFIIEGLHDEVGERTDD